MNLLLGYGFLHFFSILTTQNKNTRSFIHLRKIAVLFTVKEMFSDLSHFEEQVKMSNRHLCTRKLLKRKQKLKALRNIAYFSSNQIFSI